MHVAVVHNNIDQRSSIGKLATWAVRTALEADHRVTVVARDLDPELRGAVNWRPLYVPPKLHVVQWAAARKTVQLALRGAHPDVLHVYQPQLASLASTWHVEYLSRVAQETDSLHIGPSPKDKVVRAQQLSVARMEDHYLSRLSSRPTVLFCSEQVRDHFIRLYKAPRRQDVLYNPAFSIARRTPDRVTARHRLGVPVDAKVVGFLGGVDERKGYRELLDAVAELDGQTVLLVAGPHSDGLFDERLGSRLHSLGMLGDLADFWSAVDALAVPSRFDPFAMVVTEAAAHGVASVVTPGVGASALVERHGAGLVCGVAELTEGLSRALSRRGAYRDGCAALAQEVSAPVLGRQLLRHWLESATPSRV